MIGLDGVQSRVRRLDELARALAKESRLIADAQDPLLYLERLAYLRAVNDAIAALEDARVVLARAGQRIRAGEAAGA